MQHQHWIRIWRAFIHVVHAQAPHIQVVWSESISGKIFEAFVRRSYGLHGGTIGGHFLELYRASQMP